MAEKGHMRHSIADPPAAGIGAEQKYRLGESMPFRILSAALGRSFEYALMTRYGGRYSTGGRTATHLMSN
jgi:hypothetical protein